ncbi:MAG: preprotein translocase subunit YajC, partial [Myxococcota bacterium]
MIHHLITALVAQAEQGDGGLFGSIGSLAPFILMFAVFYFLLIRPANKQRRDHQELLNQLKK